MIPAPWNVSWSISMSAVRRQVSPSSSLMSTKASQRVGSPHVPVDAPASTRPDRRRTGGVRTGPRPPASPDASGSGSDHVSPPSADVLNNVCHDEMARPTLKYSTKDPDLCTWRTGFQHGARSPLTTTGGNQSSPCPRVSQMPQLGAPSWSPWNQATTRDPPTRHTVLAWHWPATSRTTKCLSIRHSPAQPAAQDLRGPVFPTGPQASWSPTCRLPLLRFGAYL